MYKKYLKCVIIMFILMIPTVCLFNYLVKRPSTEYRYDMILIFYGFLCCMIGYLGGRADLIANIQKEGK